MFHPRFRAFVSTTAMFLAMLVAHPAAAWGGDTQQSTAGGVHVSVTPGSLDVEGADWEFAVAFHSEGPPLQDDLLASVFLLAGEVRIRPVLWQGTGPTTGHHRVGILSFAPVSPFPSVIELHLARPGEAEARVFRWDQRGWYALEQPRTPEQ